LARGWPVTRDQLIEMLWPDEHDRAKLGARLSVQLSAVRRVLGGGVRADRETVALDLDEVSSDLEDFLRAEDDGAIVDRFPGILLPEDTYDDWTAAMRDETTRRFVAAALRQAERCLAADDYQGAVTDCRRVIEVDPYEESAHRLLLRALVASDELGAARRAHERWAAAMAELDIEIPDYDELAG
jgi:DNA-binding SARP family transcriptional activator